MTRSCGAFCVASGSRRSQLLAAAGDAGARRWLDHVRHRKLSISGDDLVAAGLKGAAVGEGLSRAMVAMLEGAPPTAGHSCAPRYRISKGYVKGPGPFTYPLGA